MKLEIRTALPSDLRDVHEMICLLEATSFDFENFKRIYYQNICNLNNIYLLAVIEKSNTVIGIISCHGQELLHHNKPVFEIQEFFVKETYRNLGVGKKLITTLENEIKRKKSVAELEVTANKLRETTHQFYLKNSFIQTHLKFTKNLTL
ncbi:MAG: GNAT family N-acetyltransferase [Chitinophaga sp.]|jgi:PhnO protein|nr:GNAT family N-acetyltransferase [Chitinophaga sp.]